jgi:hypothetical protein
MDWLASPIVRRERPVRRRLHLRILTAKGMIVHSYLTASNPEIIRIEK